MRQTSTLPMDAFFTVLSKEFGINVSRGMSVSIEEFASCLTKMEIGIDQTSAHVLANQIGHLREDYRIDAMSFMDFMAEEEKDPLNLLRDIIYLNGLNFEDIMKTMDIPKESSKLDYFKLRDGLRRVDPSISRQKSEDLAKVI